MCVAEVELFEEIFKFKLPNYMYSNKIFFFTIKNYMKNTIIISKL